MELISKNKTKFHQSFGLTFPSSYCQISLQHLTPVLYSKIPQIHSLYSLSYFILSLPRWPILSNCQIQQSRQSSHLIQLISSIWHRWSLFLEIPSLTVENFHPWYLFHWVLIFPISDSWMVPGLFICVHAIGNLIQHHVLNTTFTPMITKMYQ